MRTFLNRGSRAQLQGASVAHNPAVDRMSSVGLPFCNSAGFFSLISLSTNSLTVFWEVTAFSFCRHPDTCGGGLGGYKGKDYSPAVHLIGSCRLPKGMPVNLSGVTVHKQ